MKMCSHGSTSEDEGSPVWFVTSASAPLCVHSRHQDATSAEIVHINHEHGMTLVDTVDLLEEFGDSLSIFLEFPGWVLSIYFQSLYQVDARGESEVRLCSR